jgi:hypothetical protein
LAGGENQEEGCNADEAGGGVIELFAIMCRRNIVPDVVQGIILGGGLASSTAAFPIKNGRNVV